MDKILTITVPSYNVEAYMEKCLPTFLSKEALEDIEVLIINDGSKDQTAELGKKFEIAYPGTVRLINKENGGHGSTINSGIAEATGKYFKVIDGDDWVDSKAFVQFVEQLKGIEADVVINPYRRVYEDATPDEVSKFNGVEYNKKYSFGDAIALAGMEYRIHTVTFKTEVLRRIQPISEHCFYVDMEYIVYPMPFLQTAIFLPEVVYQYRFGTSGQSMNVKNIQKNREMHKRVLLHCLALWYSREWEGKVNAFLKSRLSKMCEFQYEIYLSMKKEEVWKEMNRFTHILQEKYPEFYVQIPGKKVWLLRVSHNLLYFPMSRLGIGTLKG